MAIALHAERAEPRRATPPVPAGTVDPVPIILDWVIGTSGGAELLAMHLTATLEGAAQVVPLISPLLYVDALGPALTARVERAFQWAKEAAPRLFQAAGDNPVAAIALRLLGDDLGGFPLPLAHAVRHNVGLVQTCDTAFGDRARARARELDAVLAGSTWMRQVLQQCGIGNVGVYPTGIDTTTFVPGPAKGHLAQRFVIFSGGPMHHHKGQDIVVAAVRAFRKKHPDTLLLTTWQTPWPESMGDLSAAGHAPQAIEVRGGRLDVLKWCADNGLPDGSVVDLGQLTPQALAVVLRECDVTLFPNRAECDGNPLLLECMATGVPVIASANTGHLDVVADERCYVLRDQQPLRGVTASAATVGWGESSVDEIVAQLEAVYTRRSEARAKAAVARQFAAAYGWDVHAPRLLDLLAPLIRELRGA